MAGVWHTFGFVDLTESYLAAIPVDVRQRYVLVETRNATKIIAATNQAAFTEIISVLRSFELTEMDIVNPGGNKSSLRHGSTRPSENWAGAKAGTILASSRF